LTNQEGDNTQRQELFILSQGPKVLGVNKDLERRDQNSSHYQPHQFSVFLILMLSLSVICMNISTHLTPISLSLAPFTVTRTIALVLASVTSICEACSETVTTKKEKTKYAWSLQQTTFL
jgi:hypothetical protein